jgi:hypothetical protein
VDLSLTSWCGGGGGDVMRPVTGGPPLGPLGADLGARVPVGRHDQQAKAMFNPFSYSFFV